MEKQAFHRCNQSYLSCLGLCEAVAANCCTASETILPALQVGSQAAGNSMCRDQTVADS